MNADNSLAIAAPRPAAPLPAPAALLPAVLALFLLGAWHIHRNPPYTPASGLGYALGIAGGSLMLSLLLYPIRKRIRLLQIFGPLKHWFRFHMLAGILGPACVLFHSTFHIGSFNAAIALYSMLLVVASGIVGRFIYRKIHHGLFGSRASLEELQMALNQQRAALQPLLAHLPGIEAETQRFLDAISFRPQGRLQSIAHFLTLGWKRMGAGRRIRRAAARLPGAAPTSPAGLEHLVQTLDAALRAAQKAAQFSTYERLFALWHVVHIPFLWMLLITAIIHVVAVHAY